MEEYDFRDDCEVCSGQGGYGDYIGGMFLGVKTCYKCKGSGKLPYEFEIELSPAPQAREEE